MLHDNYPSDDLNPRYLFSLTATDLLTKIISREIDAKELAKKELDNRGRDYKTGEWIGFKKNNQHPQQ